MKKEYDLVKMKVRKRGPVIKSDSKVQKTIRIDLDVLSWLMQEGKLKGIPYQTLINSILKTAMTANTEGLKNLVREVVREEMKKAS